MLEIIVNNQSIEVPDETIKYTKQVNDIAELSSRQTNFTDAFSLPKTDVNVQIMQSLGTAGDVSQIPYQKINAQLLDNGMHLIKDGWLEVKETAKEYKLNIRDGLIDLFKAVENKNFGDNVDLSEINHDKNLTTVINSFTNQDYRYIINDYGGKTHLASGTKINIDYLVPSVRLKYLWNKIFTTFGFSYIGNFFNTNDFDGLWLTYPKGIEQVIPLTDVYSSDNLEQGIEITNPLTAVINTGIFIYNNGTFTCTQNGVFEITASGVFTVNGEDIYTNQYYGINYYFEFLINGGLIQTFTQTEPIIIVENLVIGDVIQLIMVVPFNYNYNIVSYNIVSGGWNNLFIKKYNTLISFSEELKQLSITDFLKDILWRFGLTIFQDTDYNYIFKTFDERLQSGIVDWSDKYVERISETYTPKSYGQRNYFKQEYNDKEDNFNNGYFDITNQNLQSSKDILKSKIYSHEKDFLSFYINATTNETFFETPLWEKEISENNGVQEIKYKNLSSRFYLLRSETISQTAILRSDVLAAEQTVTSLPVARFNTTTFKDFVPKYYNNIKLLLNDFRMHKIRVALNTIDFINLDFDKIYYFEQEQNYYILNKLPFEKGKISVAEFYRIKYSESPLFGLNLYITNYSIAGGIEFTELIPYTEFQISIEITNIATGFVQTISAIYGNPLIGVNVLTGNKIRFLDINTNLPISNFYQI